MASAATRWVVALVAAAGCDGAGVQVATTSDPLETDAVEVDAKLHHRHAVEGVLPGSACGYGVGDGAGNVAFDDGNGWTVYSRDGVPSGTIVTTGFDQLEHDAYPIDSGFQIAIHRFTLPPQGVELIATWAPDGTKRGELIFGSDSPFSVGHTLSPMPRGGVFTTNTRTTGGAVRDIDFRWIDASSQLVGSYSFQETALVAWGIDGAVDTRGRTLAWFPAGSEPDAQWLDVGGAPRTPAFPSPLPAQARLAPLIGGGFAVRDGDDWIGSIASDGQTLEPAPWWLAHRPRTRLVILAHHRGYALLFDDGQTAPPRSQKIELRSRSGAWLGEIVLPPPRHHDVRSQQTRIGRDDTIVQLFTEQGATATDCFYRYWPR